MALYKVPGIDALSGTLPLSVPIIPNEGHAKYVCLDPWVNALVTLASLGTIVAFLMVRCRKRTLCRGLEYATACHIYVFISRNDRYSPIKLRSTTGLLYNFVTNQKLPIEAIELHRGCPWDSMHINWGEVTLTNGDTKIRLPYNVQIPIREDCVTLWKAQIAQLILWFSRDVHGIQLALPHFTIHQYKNLFPQGL